ncbi:MAG TPA: isoleucine--tRNA ligase [Planctomycetota bacterium]|nr:isoleucine--tRNA ligase [Planctomycetota bacterium]
MNQPAPLFKRVESQVNLPKLEEGILTLWAGLADGKGAFQDSNARRKGAQGKGEFVFYDGPPFATGTPHYGHLLAGTIKDIVPRFWNMRGYHVDRRFGWDCHGLPIENLAQKALNLNGTPEIRALGVDTFNEQCRSMVQTYVAEWRKTVTRMGRWVDFDNDYKTMDRDFMESVWWVFKRLWDQGRVYKAHRIMPYSWKLTTPLSNFEAGNNYKDVQDPAITVRFKLRAEGRKVDSPEVEAAITAGKAFVLAWTTTPWTLPSNLALCVGPEVAYQWIEDAQTTDVYLIAKDRVAAYYKKPEQFRVLAEVVGKTLVGLTYEPLFPYLAGRSGSFRVIADAFVTTGDGTGIVHIAPAYGEDDYRVSRANAIITPPVTMRINVADIKAALAGAKPSEPALDLGDLLDEEAKFVNKVTEYAGQFCKDADKAIIKRLKDEGKLVHQSTLVHSYPFCERTDTPLIYRAIEAWYVRVEDLRDKMVANNAKIRWVPEAVGSNRFGNWLKEAKDWNISRNRFWGSCLPVWINTADATDMVCFGSVAELETAAGLATGSVNDLHKHHLDKLVITKNGKTYKRTPEVLDCWFESGAMPYAQVHWMGGADGTQAPPVFPAQFIAEGLDQTRGWFYTLLVLSTALFDQPAFQNVVVNGLVLAEDGQKMSKSKKNYPDPHVVLDTYGADALRAYLIDSPVVRAEPLKFSEAGLKEIVRTVVLPYWNALSFFTTYAAVDGFDPRTVTARPARDRKPIDRWALSVLQSLVRDVNTEMEGYRLYNVVPRLVSFIDQLTNTYIRLNRARFWKSPDALDQADAYHTLYQVLTTFAKVLAPFMPFLTEEVYQRLVRPTDAKAPASVHWCDYPQADEALIDRDLERDVDLSLTVTSLARKLREDHKLKIRQPLPALTIISQDPVVRTASDRFRAAIALELNVKEVRFSADEAAFCALTVKPNLKVLGKRAGPKLKNISAALSGWSFGEVAELEAGRTISVDGEAISKDDLMLTRSPVAGAITASLGAVTVALDTALTPDLTREGLAREFVSVLQQARKDAGFEVSDRIRVVWNSEDAEVTIALTAHATFISDEVLAVELRRDASGATVADLNGRAVRYSLAKA